MHPVTLPTGGPAWLITGYDEVRAVLHDPRLVKNASAQTFLAGDRLSPELFAAINHHMLNRDPPDHTRLRRLVTAAFTRRRIDELAPRIQQITDELLGALAGAAQTDLIVSFAHPLPITVICELLGVPSERRIEVPHLVSHPRDRHDGRPSEFTAAATAMVSYLRELIATKRADPADDLLSALVAVRGARAAHPSRTAGAAARPTAPAGCRGRGTAALRRTGTDGDVPLDQRAGGDRRSHHPGSARS